MNKHVFSVAIKAILFAAYAGAQQQPIIDQILNNYSYIQSGLPNHGIAQGSIFSIFGSNLAASTASQSTPLQATLAGVTINVLVRGVATSAIPYFVSPGQIVALLPSRTPEGDGTITVTSDVRTNSAPIHVVVSAFGLLTDQNGSAAFAQNDSKGGKLLSQTDAANPGDYITLWGSGLGPISGDETQYQAQADLTTVPIEVSIGGLNSTVTFHGRSVYPGLDQINVVVPPGISGCYVSLVVTIRGVPSNFATIPVAADGLVCSDPGLAPISPDEYRGLLHLGSLNVGRISISKVISMDQQSGSMSTDSAYAIFQKYTPQQFISSNFLQQASLGSCLVIYSAGGPPLTGWNVFTRINAGAQIAVTGPYGSLALTAPNGGTYVEPEGISRPIIPSTGGSFSFQNGSDGTDVGHFTVDLSESLTTSPLVWTNSAAITAVQRAKGQLVTWIGGFPGSFVYISGYSYIHQSSPLRNGTDLYSYFTCSAPASAGQFIVPPAVLNSLPVSENGHLSVANGIFHSFTAPSLDTGLIFFGVENQISVRIN